MNPGRARMPAAPEKGKASALGIALGSGSARGWAHIGVLQALAEAGVEPVVVCGTSVGALVGAMYACDRLDAFADWVGDLNLIEIARYMDIRLVEGGGFVQGKRLMDFLSRFTGDLQIEEMPKEFAAVAADLNSGREVWFRTGPLLDALRASIALPGIFTPVEFNGQWLVDGGLVNPVPVSLCRAMGARTVIAVNLNGDIVGKHLRRRDEIAAGGTESTEKKLLEKISSGLKKRAASLGAAPPNQRGWPPGLFEVMAGSINIMQDRITRSRMAGDPPDVILAPRLSHVGLLEFDRAGEAIEEGRAYVERMRPALESAISSSRPVS
jgi:NTE family protein